jgi:hypothetical protein
MGVYTSPCTGDEHENIRNGKAELFFDIGAGGDGIDVLDESTLSNL